MEMLSLSLLERDLRTCIVWYGRESQSVTSSRPSLVCLYIEERTGGDLISLS